ncbi:MAG: sugar ABC transporter ATP-binding protein [Phycisphaeraceae bacterium]
MMQPTDDTPRLRMTGIEKRFGPTVALAGVDLSVRAGEVHALVGENGAGKSTLMRILSGAEQPDAGQMWLDGMPYAPRDPAEGRRRGVAMIYQELSLAPHLSVMENVLLGMEPVRGPLMRWRELRRRAAEAMRHIGRADIPLDMPAGRLSIAEQQLVEIARSVAVGCRVLVLDEPTSSLTRGDIERLFALIRELRDKDHAIVYISHFLEEVTEIGDRYTVLRDGASVGGGVMADTPVHDIVTMMIGREMSELYPRSARTPGEPVLTVRDLGGELKPRAATLTLRRGEVLGIAGLVGAGRTELLRALFGLDPVRHGEVKVAAFTGPATPAQRWRQGLGMVSEDRKNEGLALNLSVADNVTLAQLRDLAPLGLVPPSRQTHAAQQWIERLGIRCHSSRQRVQTLSGGNQQKIALARLLHADVDVLLLDEPTRGIDVGSKAQVYQLIDELATGDARAGRRPRAVLMVSSYLPELLGVCDRIAVMCRGRLGETHDVEDVDEHRIMLEATGAHGENHT